MTPPDTLQLRTACDAARLGGEIVARYFRDGVAMRSKESYNLVSDADVESEQAIVAHIRRVFPDHAVLAEEAHRDETSAEHLWVVDPLDGTNNFAHQLPHFAVSIAYYHRGQAQCGVIYNPVREQLYTAVRGAGAWADGEQVHVGVQPALEEVLVGVGFYYDRGAMMKATLAAIEELFGRQIHGIRRFGTASLDLVHVGLGVFGGFFEYELSPWDYAAGALFVEEAGGQITQCTGQPLSLEKTSLMASNGKLHEELLEIVKRHLP